MHHINIKIFIYYNSESQKTVFNVLACSLIGRRKLAFCNQCHMLYPAKSHVLFPSISLVNKNSRNLSRYQSCCLSVLPSPVSPCII